MASVIDQDGERATSRIIDCEVQRGSDRQAPWKLRSNSVRTRLLRLQDDVGPIGAARVSCPTRHRGQSSLRRLFSQQSPKAKLRFAQLSVSDGTSKLIKPVRKPRVFHAPNAMPTIIQITPARIAAWLRLSQSRRQMVKPEMGSTRLASLFSELRM